MPQAQESGKPSSAVRLRGMAKCSFGLSANVSSVCNSQQLQIPPPRQP